MYKKYGRTMNQIQSNQIGCANSHIYVFFFWALVTTSYPTCCLSCVYIFGRVRADSHSRQPKLRNALSTTIHSCYIYSEIELCTGLPSAASVAFVHFSPAGEFNHLSITFDNAHYFFPSFSSICTKAGTLCWQTILGNPPTF